MNPVYEIRKATNLSQEDFGKAIGVGQTAVSNYEKNIRAPESDKAIAIQELGEKHGKDIPLKNILLIGKDAA